jgi:hypothetical protein
MDRSCLAFGVYYLAVHGMAGRAHGPSRGRKNERRDNKSGRTRNHENKSHRRHSKTGALVRNGPIHDCSRDGSYRAQYHSRKTHVTPSSFLPNKMMGEKDAGSRRPKRNNTTFLQSVIAKMVRGSYLMRPPLPTAKNQELTRESRGNYEKKILTIESQNVGRSSHSTV